MHLRKALLFLAVAVILAASALLAYRYARTPQHDNLAVLHYLPRDPSAVIYIDVAALRQSPFVAQLAAWAPQPQQDPGYAQFIADTGFNFERDLDSLAIAEARANTSNSKGALFFAGEGRFDRQRIAAYAQRTGTKHIVNGHEMFFVPFDADKSTLAFALLSDRLLVAGAGAQVPDEMFSAPAKESAKEGWREHFERLAGSPVFAVFRQDADAVSTLADRAPGGFRSPQLASVLNQLQWITVAAKPDADQLRLVAEGEAASESTQRQLADALNGVVILAEAGLSDPKVRQQLAPDVRQACLDLLKSADISRIDRGETKSVRLVFSVTPQFLEAARRYSTFGPQSPNANAAPPPATRRPTVRKSGI
jgi:hypothetical protein